MNGRSIALLGAATLSGAAMMGLLGNGRAMAASRDNSNVQLAVPAGITLVDVSKGDYGARDEFLWRRLGDARGQPLYTYTLEGNSGKPNCYGECAKEFPPLLAPRGAAAFGDWSLIDRPEGQQWAYRGQPLYTFAESQQEDTAAEGGNDRGRGFAGKFDPGGKGFSPKAGWRQAVYDAAQSVRTPADIRLESLEAANGYAFVVAPTGMPIYILKSEPKDTSTWTPLFAPSLALPVGDFTMARRSDGTRQWTYQGERLYTYNGDYSSSDINGLTQKGARIALAYRFFMPAELAINVLPMRPPMMTTAKGLAVYTEVRYHLQYGGRETRGGYHYTYADAKDVGTSGCVAACTKTWRPVLAPANATGRGFWEAVPRADGSKQWAYKGSALYTYVGDAAPGDIKGNNKAVFVYGDPQDHLAAVLGEGYSGGVGGTDFSRDGDTQGSLDLMSIAGGRLINPRANYGGSFGAGFYWHLVPLYN